MKLLITLALVLAVGNAISSELKVPIVCEGDYRHHLQGVALGSGDEIFWSFTTELVKTDRKGVVIKSIPVENHHGDLCFDKGKIYVAVNLGKFNDPEGNGDSHIYIYDAASLEFLAKHPVQEVFHGAGGIGIRNGNFFVVGGLPDGVQENYVYEYDATFRFLKKHIIKSGWTHLGIQTATWHDGAWWFGCYGSPPSLLKTDAAFKLLSRTECNCSLGIVGLEQGKMLAATGPRTREGRCRGILHLAVPDERSGLKLIDSSTASPSPE